MGVCIMSKKSNITVEELENINNELYKAQSLMKILRMAVICTEYTNIKLDNEDIVFSLETIESIADKQTLEILEYL